MSKKRLYSVLLSCALFVCACGARPGTYASCKTPTNITESDLAGVWQATYSNHTVSDPLQGSLIISDTKVYFIAPEATPMRLDGCPGVGETDAHWTTCWLLHGKDYKMSGKEQLTLNPDMYEHSFFSGNQTYGPESNSWQLIQGEPDSPKMRLNNLTYFAEGLDFSSRRVPMYLAPQMPDLMNIQSARQTSSQVYESAVKYPETGYLYLYPRVCSGELVLQQMVFEIQEPDNFSISNPVFHRTSK